MSYVHPIKPGQKVRLKDYDPGERGGMKRAEGEAKTAKLGEEMCRYHDLHFAAAEKSLLIVLQGLDTSGKDGLIRHLTTLLNAQSCNVVSFKQPTPEDLAHDFLWRVHPKTPAKGYISIFNRSHYEDVLIVRVHNLAPEKVWRKRYEHINHFESLLADSGTIIMKFFLHISKEEQEERLLDREKEPEKSWKLSVQDWKERERWDDYVEAFEDALSECSPSHAPWYVVPANHKWYRNLAVTECIVRTMRPYREEWMKDLEQRGEVAKQALVEFRRAEGNKKDDGK
jgi:PPK2 family polyphosphate:nucleotide phosphotransferase